MAENSKIIESLRDAASAPDLSIGQAWNRLDAAADTIEDMAATWSLMIWINRLSTLTPDSAASIVRDAFGIMADCIEQEGPLTSDEIREAGGWIVAGVELDSSLVKMREVGR